MQDLTPKLYLAGLYVIEEPAKAILVSRTMKYWDGVPEINLKYFTLAIIAYHKLIGPNMPGKCYLSLPVTYTGSVEEPVMAY
jgi:hypothetical protein